MGFVGNAGRAHHHALISAAKTVHDCLFCDPLVITGHRPQRLINAGPALIRRCGFLWLWGVLNLIPAGGRGPERRARRRDDGEPLVRRSGCRPDLAPDRVGRVAGEVPLETTPWRPCSDTPRPRGGWQSGLCQDERHQTWYQGRGLCNLPTTTTSSMCVCAPPGVGGGPRVVVSTAAFHARVRGSVPGPGGLKETKMLLPHPRVKVSIAGSLRDREPGLEFRILCLEDSVISIISPSSGGSPGPV